MKHLLSALSLIALATSVQAQSKDGFKVQPNGLEYKMVKDVPGTKKPVLGDYVEVHLFTKIGDSLLFDTRQMNANNPVQFQVQPPSFNGDLVEGIMMMTEGDSAIFHVSVDSIVKASGGQQFPWMKPNTNQKLMYAVKLVSVKTKAEMQKEQEDKAAAQVKIDDKLIQDYIAANKLKAQKTESGLYYVISKQGTGANAQSGQRVTVNYTGKLLDGQVFDSNVDSNFHHVQPFSFLLGAGQVIKGWDEGVALLKKGSKATLLIPSPLAYGANGQGPIKANSVLIFDIEVMDIENNEQK